MVNKKGDMLTPMQLILIVLGIIGLIVGLAAIYLLDLRGEADDKACRMSVLARSGVSSVLPTATQGFIPLRCTTDKICITDSKKNQCSQFAGEEGVKYVEIDKIDASRKKPELAANEIVKTNVEAMYDCWNLMGQGKLDIFPGTEADLFATFTGNTWTIKYPTCFICSRVAISKSLTDNKLYFEKVKENIDTKSFMEKNRPDSSLKSYSELFGAGGSYLGDYVRGKELLSSQSAIIFTQIITPGDTLKTFFGASAGTGLALSAGSGWLGFGKAVISKVGASAVAAASVLSGLVAALSLSESQDYSAGVCGDLSSNKESARQGCSFVGKYDYNEAAKINQKCFYIEGNP